MLPAALRVVVYFHGLAAYPSKVGAHAAIFIALLLCARRMIELTGGTAQLGSLSLGDQLALAYPVLHPIGLLIVGLYMGLSFIGARTLAPRRELQPGPASSTAVLATAAAGLPGYLER
jgi:hypothetical protein